jgi:membrane peptidoglycan carboxypeptidase/uncharacterized protein YgiM (DUF1202 family)
LRNTFKKHWSSVVRQSVSEALEESRFNLLEHEEQSFVSEEYGVHARKERAVRRRNAALRVALIFFVLVTGSLALYETYSSAVQAHYFSKLGKELNFELNEGPSDFLKAPSGPYDTRLGYSALPIFSRKLQEQGFVVAAQAKTSELMTNLNDMGLFPVYREKIQAGLTILDAKGDTLFSRTYPNRTFTTFSEIPPVIVNMLLFVENKQLLDPSRPYFNPAVDWRRLCKALIEKGMQVLDLKDSASGGSTLATQLEKLRHSENGITFSMKEKVVQMVSASLRAYLDGKDTTLTRQRIVRDYFNSMPLASVPGYGEVYGLGDGLWAWYDVELRDVIDAVEAPTSANNPVGLDNKALRLKQALSLIMAQNRPTELLLESPEYLSAKCNRYIRLMRNEGIITDQLAEQMLQAELTFRTEGLQQLQASTVRKKAAYHLRTRLLSLLGVERLYSLDRIDLSVKSTFDLPMQTAVSEEIMKLRDPGWIAKKGLNDRHTLGKGDPKKVIYSFTLYESTNRGNFLRVQTDNYDRHLDINAGSMLDLGSTAKLRTLVHYLEIIGLLHQKYATLKHEDLLKVKLGPEQTLSRWVISYLLDTDERDLKAMLHAAMERAYSADPNTRFYTGGGLHTFENFSKRDDHRVVTVREAFRLSLNLPFIRLMRDIVSYHIFGDTAPAREILRDPNHPVRDEYLAKFADFEGSTFIKRFFSKYKGKSSDEILSTLLKAARYRPQRLAMVHRYFYPEKDVAHFHTFLRDHLPESDLGPAVLEGLYQKQTRDRRALSDLATVLKCHPLELWVADYLHRNPLATRGEVLAKSVAARQESYTWLFNTSVKTAQDNRIWIILEREAFEKIHAAWKRLGYPFDTLTPSFATALGSSGDRPAALAALMGILVNDGKRLPTQVVEELRFAEGTPYETRFIHDPGAGVRVIEAEIAAVVRESLFDVVEEGTAKRLHGAFSRTDGTYVPVGGKTGTGDHRYKIYGKGGQLITSRVVDRSATFAFIIGDRFFGNITAFVSGPDASDYSFTSSLPVTVLKILSETLMDAVDPPRLRRPVVQTARASERRREFQPERRDRQILTGIKTGFPRTALVNVSVANMRARPTTESAILAKLKVGDRVTLILRDREWYLVRLPSDRLAWAYHGLFRDQEDQTEQPLFSSEVKPGSSPGQDRIKPSLKGGVVDVSVANMRARPTTESPILGQLRAGERVTLLFQENEWFMVRLPDDRLAWGHQSLFRDQESPADSREPKPKQVVEKPTNSEPS